LPKKQTDAFEVGQKNAFSIMEAGDPGPVEKVSETDFASQAELASFMQEICTVVVAPSTEGGALEVITPNVNGINQPIVRGKPTKIKRKYVEALARGRTIVYDQQVQDPTRPENIQMVERGAITYPFSVLSDPSGDKGAAWLRAILAQPL